MPRPLQLAVSARGYRNVMEVVDPDPRALALVGDDGRLRS
jgi:hypothetical protein